MEIERESLIQPAQRPHSDHVSVRSAQHPVFHRRELSNAQMDRECPKCLSLNSVSASECRSCGVVFERFRDLEEQAALEEMIFAQRYELLQAWARIMEDYSALELHEAFVMDCERLGSLSFAARKYQDILDGAPIEEIARMMQRRVLGLTLQKVERTRVAGGWTAHVPMLNGIVILLATAVLTIGLLAPNAAPMIWVGASGLVLAFGIRRLSGLRF